jgi:tetratricopeptide (TPR) repeat protein
MDVNEKVDQSKIKAEEPETATTANDTAQVWISAFVIAILAFLTYSHTLSIPFHGEDQRLFVDSGALQHIGTATAHQADLPAAPLTLFGFALNQTVLPAGPIWLHLVSLLFHLGNAVLVYLVCRQVLGNRVPERITMLAGMLFAVHPIGTITIGYLVERSAAQGSFFALLATWFFLHATAAKDARAGISAASLLCYALAVASDFRFLIMPLLFVAISRVQPNNDKPAHSSSMAHQVYLAFMGLLAVAIVGGRVVQETATPISLTEILQIASRYAQDFSLALVWPSGILPLDTPTTLSMPGAAVLGVLLLVGLLLLTKKSPLGLAMLWCALALIAGATVASFDGVTAHNEAYFSVAGLAILVPWLLATVKAEGLMRVLGIGVATIILALAAVSYQNLSLWRQPAQLWQRVAQSAPDDHRPWMNIGKLILNEAQFASDPQDRLTTITQAEVPLREAYSRAPDDPEILRRLGMVLRATGKGEEALNLLKNTLRQNPYDVFAAMELSAILDEKVRTNPDIDLLRTSVDYLQGVPHAALPPNARVRYAMAESTFGNYDRSVALLNAVVDTTTDSPLTRQLQQDTAVLTQERQLDAMSQQQLAANPTGIDGLLSRAKMQLTRKNPLRASYLLDTVLERKPAHQEGWSLMGISRAQMSQYEGFVTEWGSLEAVTEARWMGLVDQCATLGMWGAGVRYLQLAPGIEPEKPAHLTMADIAQEKGQIPIAAQLAQQAAALHATDPRPWLMLSDLAIAANQPHAARASLNEAEKRGADKAAIEKRAQAAGIDTTLPFRPERTIIR